MKLDGQLLKWAHTSNSGFTATFTFADEDTAREYFQTKTLAKGKQAGQMFAINFAELDDFGNEPAPVPRKFQGGPIARLLILDWCKDPLFWEYTNSKNEQQAAHFVKIICNVESRNQIDGNRAAEEQFHELIRKPYQAWLQKQEAVAA